MINIISESRDGVITVFKVKVAQWLMTSVIAVTWARRPEQERQSVTRARELEITIQWEALVGREKISPRA